MVPDKIQNMIAARNFRAYRCAARNGHIETLNYLKSKAPDKIRNMIAAGNFEAYRWAAANGHIETLIHLESKISDKIQDMIAAGNFEAYQCAAQNGHLKTLIYLELKAPSNIQDMIAADNFGAYRCAAQSGHIETVNHLLISNTACFAYAESHVREYGNIINPFIASALLTLHQHGEELAAQDQNAVFDTQDAEEAKRCFYILRNLIRSNNPDNDDEIRFLLNIPAVKILAHQEISPHYSNELLRLAMACGNQHAAALLLNIDAVRRLAEHNNFYQREQSHGVDLRQLALDRESSMTALTEGEAKKLTAVTTRYQPMIKEAGAPLIIKELKSVLAEHYENTPASMTLGEDNLNLPLSYEEFLSLKLTTEQQGAALKAYYTHYAHTAYRYLSKPNAWMHPKASYVNINEDNTERWSTFEEYEPLIALLYLAAIDKTMPATGGHTLESRSLHFIHELALIGRAHNWDKTRVRAGKAEEYDDLEGDKPSCFSGVKRRLFQSVIGHPLFDGLDESIIDAELRQSVFEYFKGVLANNDKQAIKEVLDAVLGLDGEIPCDDKVDSLICFNMPLAEQQLFIQYLMEKYGSEFTQQPKFLEQINDWAVSNSKCNNVKFIGPISFKIKSVIGKK